MSDPPRRVVLLGASNLTRSISTAVATARQLSHGPLEILIAHGHGRSYGRRSSVLIRALPGIIECGLWDALAQSASVPTFAAIGDIGNDVLYGFPVPQILAWVEQTLDRLESAGARTVLTLPPLCNLSRASSWQVQSLLKVFYPKYSLSPRELCARANELDRQLRLLAEQRQIPWIEPRREWYGFDPIHIRAAHVGAYWGEVSSAWAVGGSEDSPEERRGGEPRSPSWRQWLRLRSSLPERLWIAGIERHTRQSAREFEAGLTLRFY